MTGLLFSKRVIGFLLVLLLGGGTASVFAVSEAARNEALSYWHKALVWAGVHTADAGAEQWFWCPMHPEIKRKNANDVCPICNMALVPLDGEGKSTDALVLTPQQVQQAGVVTEPVLRRKLYREIDTTGRLACDERLHQHITSWVSGKSRIVKQYVNFVGDKVEKGKVLAEIYSPDLITAQDEYLIALKNSAMVPSLVKASRQRLLYFGMTPAQIDKLAKRGKVWDAMPIEATISGTVLERLVKEGQYVNEGQSLFHIADLSRLWLFADVYEDELPLVEEGQPATLSIRGLPGKTFKATVAFIDPMVQTQTRTVRVRFNIDNKDRKLKPGMYARVQIKSAIPKTLAVPENAVLWSGKRTIVLVKQAKGHFQPREVRLGQKWLYPFVVKKSSHAKKLEFGAKYQRYHQVLAGLAPGDEVVTAGAFLLNAESQFQNILAKMLPPESESATLEEAVGKDVAKHMRKLLQAYYAVSKALADDKLKLVSAKAETLVQAANALAKQAEQVKMPKLVHEATDVKDFAQELAAPKPKDLKEARYHFGRISRSTVQLLMDNGGTTLFGRELFLFRCGMAKVGYENWLWWSRTKLNPYMGQRMLTCGSELKTLGHHEDKK